jgi:hypothetical protein
VRAATTVAVSRNVRCTAPWLPMELTLCAGGAISHDVDLSARVLLVIDKMGYPVAGIFTDAPTLLVAQHRESGLPFGPSEKASEARALGSHERMFALASSLGEFRHPFLSTPESQNEAPHARRAPAYRAALASDDDIDALLVAAIVTQRGAESSESVRDRAAALDAHIFRVLPRDAQGTAPLPVRSPQSRSAGVAAAAGPHFSVSSNRSSSQGLSGAR